MVHTGIPSEVFMTPRAKGQGLPRLAELIVHSLVLVNSVSRKLLRQWRLGLLFVFWEDSAPSQPAGPQRNQPRPHTGTRTQSPLIYPATIHEKYPGCQVQRLPFRECLRREPALLGQRLRRHLSAPCLESVLYKDASKC